MPLEGFVAACGFGFVEVLTFELDHGTAFGIC